MLEKIFKLKENNTTVQRELIAGIITFLTMAYILVVNPDILSKAGINLTPDQMLAFKGALFTGTALATVLATLLMAGLTNLPIAQAPGMGLNNFFAFTVVLSMGKTFEFAITAVFLQGIIFVLLTFFNVREIIVKSIPRVLKEAIPVGIGLFITLIGLKSAGLIVPFEPTLVKLSTLTNPHTWMAMLGLIIIGVLLALRVNGAILIGIIGATLFGIFLGEVSMPAGSWVSLPPSIAPIFAKFDWSDVFTFDMLIVTLTFLFINLFDAMGTLIGVVSKAGLADKDGNFPQLKRALTADACSTVIGSILGTSTVTSYIESASGVAAGGRTGLTSVSTAGMFAIAMFFSPLIVMIPSAATAPALIIVGLFMFTAVAKIDFDDMTNAIPAFLTIVFMPFAYSIAQGIVFGVLSYTFLKVFSGKFKSISITMYILTTLFIAKLVLDALDLFTKH